jgi:hypothetical protein
MVARRIIEKNAPFQSNECLRLSSYTKRLLQMRIPMPEEWRKNPIPLVVTGALSLGILIALIRAAWSQMTATESVLLSILLSAASILVSWLVTYVYSQASLDEAIRRATEANTENIRNYAQKAAEKVLNLSNELQRLIDALVAAREEAGEVEVDKDSAVLLDERIAAAIHNLETLRSMNDTFLSDWRGVIGEEIARQDLLETQIEELKKELDESRRERLAIESQYRSSQYRSEELLAHLHQRSASLERELVEKLKELPFRVTAPPKKRSKKEISLACPSCNKTSKVTIRIRPGAKKLLHCPHCKNWLKVETRHDEKVDVTEVAMYHFDAPCPVCSSMFHGEIPDYRGTMEHMACPSCSMPLKISRSTEDINIRLDGSLREHLPQKLVEAVMKRLPEQPWPKHIHKEIADDLGVSNTLVQRIIGSQIAQGVLAAPSSPVEPLSTNGDATQSPENT